MAYLKIDDGQREEGVFRLVEDTIIGRAPSSNLCLSDMRASRAHAMVRCTDGRWQVLDLGSSNGTHFNDEVLYESDCRFLNDGDRIRIGSTKIVFFSGESATEKVNEPGRQQIRASRFPDGTDIVRAKEIPSSDQKKNDDIASGHPASDSPLGVLTRISRLAARTGMVEPLFETTMDAVASLYPESSRIFLHLPDSASGLLLPHMGRFPNSKENCTGGFADPPSGVLYAFSQPLLNAITKCHEGMITDGVRTEYGESHDDDCDLKNRVMCVPLVCEEVVYGALSVEACCSTSAFTKIDLALLQAIADQLAQTICRSGLRKTLEKVRKVLPK